MTRGRLNLFTTLFSLAWLPFTFLFVQDAFSNPALASRRPLLMGLLLAQSALYVAFWTWLRHAPQAWIRLVATAGMTGLCTLIVVNGGAQYGVIFVYATVSAAAAFDVGPAAVAVLANCLVVLFGDYSLVHDWLQASLATLQMALAGAAVIGTGMMGATVLALREARDELARLAVAEERVRFARDLHDLLGHSLSVVVLKSELAGSLIEAEPERAAAEIADVERVARQSLRDVREAVAGYRSTTLRSEIEGAREMLEAAGISYSVKDGSGDLPANSDSVLAWAVREGATNVIRHSSARECSVTVWREGGVATLEVVDNGRGLDTAPNPDGGHGLQGLAERAGAIGGNVVTDGSRGFTLRVTVPSGAP